MQLVSQNQCKPCRFINNILTNLAADHQSLSDIRQFIPDMLSMMIRLHVARLSIIILLDKKYKLIDFFLSLSHRSHYSSSLMDLVVTNIHSRAGNRPAGKSARAQKFVQKNRFHKSGFFNNSLLFKITCRFLKVRFSGFHFQSSFVLLDKILPDPVKNNMNNA